MNPVHTKLSSLKLENRPKYFHIEKRKRSRSIKTGENFLENNAS